ncbi:hypothetical protein KAFR_0H02740 [Kazachstania africana CBS 2517]|uniref:Uncharacterized protein n=1 Tax=Kazachstania africana (strain ATCC 22294 / BCRC 22015 / CBS 2517 / CECT 1963 / NBRC 1671 / NRRL Y-8276) TaxID=1071382 RepID=H2AZC7_KAZAF|nr:hypothetical protein KAFR_0H02740 [Kazachstania africana CBS 2517]CCF59683.1 hypothetical protein KAFR_0H02740 [Kazachstania africana CBS 2517]
MSGIEVIESKVVPKLPIVLESKENGTEETVVIVEEASSPKTLTNYQKHFKIIKFILNSVSGKDKIVKLLKCILEILRSFKLINGPFFQAVAFQLNLFRYLLRFGYTPIRLVELFQNLKDKQLIYNENFLQKVIDLYYGIFDELDLLNKLKIIRCSPRLAHWIDKHETISWEMDILLNLKQDLQRYDNHSNILLKLDILRLVCELVTNTFPTNGTFYTKKSGLILSLISSISGLSKFYIQTYKDI